ncbi:hypothetical protein BKA57DRAFT_177503 [Linnemannia elongata]|nr:hypothetical protein BKA57DRAFT_177503 [Linnemannia elongata]
MAPSRIPFDSIDTTHFSFFFIQNSLFPSFSTHTHAHSTLSFHLFPSLVFNKIRFSAYHNPPLPPSESSYPKKTQQKNNRALRVPNHPHPQHNNASNTYRPRLWERQVPSFFSTPYRMHTTIDRNNARTSSSPKNQIFLKNHACTFQSTSLRNSGRSAQKTLESLNSSFKRSNNNSTMKQINGARRKRLPVVERRKRPEGFYKRSWNGKRLRRSIVAGRMHYN